MRYTVYYQRFFGLLRPDEVRGARLSFTHRRLWQVEAASLDEVFQVMQGEVWSPRGEARPLIRRLHLSHTSLSVGDVVQAENSRYWVCNFRGWTLLNSPELSDQRLWLSTEADMTVTPPQIVRLKISDERDCLPPDAYTVEQFGWVEFGDLVALAKLMEQRFGWAVCIDLGEEFYETGQELGETTKTYVGYYLSGGWQHAILSVFAASPEAARVRIETELQKPGRQRYWQLWVRDGRLVKEKPEEARNA